VAAHVEPEILIVDEVLAVGDAEFQRKCLGKMEEVGQKGRTVLFVSHNLTAIKKLCKRCVFLQGGRVAYQGDTLTATGLYQGGPPGNSTRRWSETGRPSIRSAQLCEVEILSDGRNVGFDLPTEKPIQVSVKFRVTSDGAKVGASISVNNSDDQLLFASVSNHEPRWHLKSRPAGMYRSTCEIPANLLAGGSYSISVGLWEGFYEAGIVENDVLRVALHEEGFVTGDMPYEVRRGLIRPLLRWVSAPCDEPSNR
jgi:lipopolysaccharide transport system ATP-binding protein